MALVSHCALNTFVGAEILFGAATAQTGPPDC